ncbi:MAG: sigma-70 family RNA polymerase sigma factor [Cytophagales bacterium]
MNISNENIIEHVLQGKDREVIKYLYQKIFPQIKKNLIKKGAQKEDIEDVFQEAVMIFYKMIMDKKIDRSLNITGLLYTITVNRWTNLLRKNSRNVIVDFQEDTKFDIRTEDVKEIEMVKKEKNALQSLFSQIGQKCIDLLSLSIYKDLSIEDIQSRFAFTSEGATKMQIKRCKDKLNELIEKNPKLVNQLLEYV